MMLAVGGFSLSSQGNSSLGPVSIPLLHAGKVRFREVETLAI